MLSVNKLLLYCLWAELTVSKATMRKLLTQNTQQHHSHSIHEERKKRSTEYIISISHSFFSNKQESETE